MSDKLNRALQVLRTRGLLQELWYAVLLRASTPTRLALKYFRATSYGGAQAYASKVLETEDVNSPEILALLTKMAPDLIVVWCSAILRPLILGTAQKIINFHTGILPQYRGAVANQYAVYRRDLAHIGSTIHYVTAGVDRGDIITQIYGDTSKRPQEMFRELNDASLDAFLETARKIYAGEEVLSHAQDQTQGEFFRLGEWTNRMRWIVGRQLLRWEKTGKF